MSGLFALGSNGSGQLGLSHKQDVSVPKPVTFHSSSSSNAASSSSSPAPPRPNPLDHIVKIAAGGNHTLALTAGGRAFWAGDSSAGACGVTTIATADSSIFEALVLSEDDGSAEQVGKGEVAAVACTWTSSTLVLRDEAGRATRVVSCGTGEQGQLGFEAAGIAAPRLVENFPPPGTQIVDLAGGLAHVVAVLDNGEVWGWGNGRKGQLGQLVALPEGTAPVPIVHLAPARIGEASGVDFKVVRAVCGQYSTALFGEAGEGRVKVLGTEKWGLVSDVPRSVAGWKTVAATWGGIYVLRHDGSVVAWGRDDHGQLPPPGLPRIVDIAAGSEHVVALTGEGEVIAWGWGEHGNCGPQTDGASGDVKGRWNVIASAKNLPEDSAITAIGAGCATSWIYISNEGVHL